ncbi:hypothetical protein LARI1_G008508, partial [Lachnellula arida]
PGPSGRSSPSRRGSGSAPRDRECEYRGYGEQYGCERGWGAAVWGDYADERLAVLPVNNTAFQVTVPELGGRCKVAGECVLQWWWYGTAVEQTYESCLDFTVAPAASTKLRSRFWRY